MMINKLRLKPDKAKELYQNIADYAIQFFKEEYNINLEIHMSNTTSIDMAMNNTHINENQKQACIVLGIKEIAQCRSNILPDHMAVKPVINLLHEIQHIQQFADFLNKNEKDPNTIYLAISKLARNGNDRYYRLNYDIMPFEINAEHNGIMDAYNYFVMINPKKEKYIQKLICNHVNNRIDNSNYYISKPKGGFKTINEIDQAFITAFEKSKTAQRYYPYDRQDQEILQDKLWHDIRYTYASDEFFKTYNHGIMQDKIIAGINLNLYPERISEFPILQNHAENLQLKNIINESKIRHDTKIQKPEPTAKTVITVTPYDSPDF